MTGSKLPTLEEYWMALAESMPEFSPDEQRAAVTLYRELAKGHPLSPEGLAGALGVVTAEARELLECDSMKPFVYLDDQGKILGFGGLAATPMHHKLLVDGCTLWTWCAFDNLFIPEILGKTARVESPDPETGDLVRLTVTPSGVETVEPETAVVSLLRPDSSEFTSAANVMAKFCHFVFFFASRESGERWVRKHAGTFLYPLREIQQLARRLNARKFGLELARRSTTAA